MPLAKENIENLTDAIIYAEWQTQTFVADNVNDIFEKTYQNVYAEREKNTILMPGLLCVIYLLLPNDVKDILR